MRRILRTVRVPEMLDNDIEELRELNSSTYTEALILQETTCAQAFP